MLGGAACLAGGAQLHSRANIEALGGLIDTGSLAEDTITTFDTQRAGLRVIFEPHATVWAEEPDSVSGLWKQRLRWARGNIQVTMKFRHQRFQPQPGNRLDTFGLFWFALLLLPILMVCASASLVTLFFIDYSLAWEAFHVLWITNVITYAFITSFALMIDTRTARRVWREALMFPGAVERDHHRGRRDTRPAALARHPWGVRGGLSITSGYVRGLGCSPTSGWPGAWAWRSSPSPPRPAGSAGSPARH